MGAGLFPVAGALVELSHPVAVVHGPVGCLAAGPVCCRVGLSYRPHHAVRGFLFPAAFGYCVPNFSGLSGLLRLQIPALLPSTSCLPLPPVPVRQAFYLQHLVAEFLSPGQW